MCIPSCPLLPQPRAALRAAEAVRRQCPGGGRENEEAQVSPAEPGSGGCWPLRGLRLPHQLEGDKPRHAEVLRSVSSTQWPRTEAPRSRAGTEEWDAPYSLPGPKARQEHPELRGPWLEAPD